MGINGSLNPRLELEMSFATEFDQMGKILLGWD